MELCFLLEIQSILYSKLKSKIYKVKYERTGKISKCF